MRKLHLSQGSWALISSGLVLVGITSISFGFMALLLESGLDVGINLPFGLSYVFIATSIILGVIMFWIAFIALAVGRREEESYRMVMWASKIQESLIDVRYPLTAKKLYPVGESLSSLFFNTRGWIMLVRTPGLLIRGEVERRRYIEVMSDFVSNDWDVAYAQSRLRSKLEENEERFSMVDSFPDKSHGKALMSTYKLPGVDIAVGIWVSLKRSSQPGIEESVLLNDVLATVLALIVRQLSVLLAEVIDKETNSSGELFGLLVKGLVHELSGELQGTYNKLAFAQSALANDRRLSTAHERNFALASSSLIRSHQLIELMRDIPYIQENMIVASQPERVNFKGLLLDIVKEMREAYPDVSFKTKVASGIVSVTAGANVKSVLRNTIRNAASFSPEGGMVSVSCKRKGDFLAIVVLDDGPGVSAKAAELVFDPTRGSKIRPNGTKGMGVGMAISRMIARSYGGDITCIPNSNVNGGCFEIILPIVDPGELNERFKSSCDSRR